MTSGFESSEFPPNSHRAKEAVAEEAPIKIEKVTEGAVIRRKTPMGRRFVSLFIAGDPNTAMKDVLMTVLLPQAKDMAADMLTQYFEKLIYGDARSTLRRPGLSRTTSVGGSTHVPYNRYSANKAAESVRPSLSARSRATHNFDDIILETRPEATHVIDMLIDFIDRYEQATVANLFELVGETPSYTDRNWGWKNLSNAEVVRVRDGYFIKLPEPQALK